MLQSDLSLSQSFEPHAGCQKDCCDLTQQVTPYTLCLRPSWGGKRGKRKQNAVITTHLFNFSWQGWRDCPSNGITLLVPAAVLPPDSRGTFVKTKYNNLIMNYFFQGNRKKIKDILYLLSLHLESRGILLYREWGSRELMCKRLFFLFFFN